MTTNQAARRNEYLPSESEHNGNGNGNGHKKFGLIPATDQDSLTVIHSRENCIQDERLSRSEKAFVTFAIDWCLHPRNYSDYRKGIACVADSVPARIFGVTERTIYNWRHKEAVRDYVWFSKVRQPDKWAMMLYHLTALHPAPKEKVSWHNTTGGAYAAGAKARQAEPPADAAAKGRERRNAALVAKRAQSTLPLQGGIAVVTGNFQPVPTPENHDLQAFSAVSQNNFRPTAETVFGCQPKVISAASRNEFRLPAETNFGSEPKGISAASRKELPPPAETACRDIEPQIEPERLSKERGGEGIPPAPHPEMVFWESKWWFESKLHRQLKLLEEGIADATGDARKRLKDRRHSLLVALGVAMPKQPAAVTRRIEKALAAKIELPPADLAKWISGLREAAK